MATPPAVRALEYHLVAFRRTLRGNLLRSLLAPVLYLGSIGLGLGKLVDAHGTSLGGYSYTEYLAPGLLAAFAMQTAVNDGAWPVLGGLKWQGTYLAQIATPIEPDDVALGHLSMIALHTLLGALTFLVVMVCFGAAGSPLVVFAVAAAVLTAMVHAVWMASYSVRREEDNSFSAIFRFVVNPMFLFSGTFFPIAQLPPVLRFAAYLTPLWHGVSLCRSLSLGDVPFWPTLGHVLYLCVVGGIGFVVCLAGYRERLSR